MSTGRVANDDKRRHKRGKNEAKENIRTAKDTTTAPDAADGRCKAVTTVRGHSGLCDLKRLAQSGDLEQVEAGAEKQVGELDRLLLELLWGRSSGSNGCGRHGECIGGRKGEEGEKRQGRCFERS